MGAKIVRTNEKGEILYYKEDKVVKKMGTSGYVYLPVGLIDKEVTIKYNELEE